MYCKIKIGFLICILVFSGSADCKSLIAKFRDLFSFQLPTDLLSAVNKEIVGTIKAKKITLRLPNSVDAEAVDILDEQGKRVIYAKRVSAKVSLLSLLTSNIKITEGFIDSPFLNYTIEKDVHNIIRVFEPKQKSDKESDVRVSIEKIKLINGNFEMFHDAGVEISAEKVAAEGSFWLGGGEFNVNLAKISVDHGGILAKGIDFPLSKLEAKDLSISDEKIQTKSLSAIYGHAKVSALGTVFIDKERYDLSFDVDAPAGTYPAGLKPLPFVMPAFKAHVEMLGDLKNPEFLTNVIFSGTEFNNLKIKQGQAQVQINLDQVVINSASMKVGEKGNILANGEIDINKKTFKFVSKQSGINVAELLKFLDLKIASSGVFEAKTDLDGSFEKESINIFSSGSVVNGGIHDVSFPKLSSFKFSGNLILDKRLKINDATIKNTQGLNFNFAGETDLVKKATVGKFKLFCPELNEHVVLPEDGSVKALKTEGSIFFDLHGLDLKADAISESARFFKIDASKIAANIEFKNNALRVNKMTAKIADGDADLNLIVDKFTSQKIINGSANINQIELKKISPALGTVNLEGALSAKLNLGGNLSAPEVQFYSDVTDLVVDKVQIKNAEFEGQFKNNIVNIFRVYSNTIFGDLSGENFSYDLKSKAIKGQFEADNFDISSAFSSYDASIDGYINGTIFIDGTVSQPKILAPLRVSKLTAYGLSFGDGTVSISLSEQPLIGHGKDLVFTASANLWEKSSNIIGRFSYALNKKTINSEISLENLTINSLELGLVNKYVGMLGRASGIFTAEGPIKSPKINSKLLIKDFGFFDPNLRKDAVVITKYFGPAILEAESKDGRINVDICANLKESISENSCDKDSGLLLKVSGPFSLDKYSLNILGKIEHDKFEEILTPLKKSFISLGASVDISGSLNKEISKPLNIRANFLINKLQSSLPNIPVVSLVKPVSISLLNDSIKFSEDAVLQFSPGEVAIGGTYSPSALDVHAEGEIPLMLSRLFVPMVQSAEGLASGKLRIFGSTDALMLEGAITPQYGSTISLRKWLDPIRVKEGSIVFETMGNKAFKSKFNNIRLSIGDGKMSLFGDVTKQYKNAKSEEMIAFDLNTQGSNIVIRDNLNFVETDFNIHTTQKQNNKPIIEGEIIVTDGAAHQQFDLRNFVAQTQSSTKMDSFKFLENTSMQTNLKFSVRQFKASASMLNLDIETNLRGQLTLEGPLSRPKFKGALGVTDGLIKFPATSFDLVNSQIVLDENSSKVFDPKIDIVAMEELNKADYAALKENTTVEFSLKGDLDRLNIELRPIQGDRSLSQLKIFMLLLSPRNSSLSGSDDPFGDLKLGAKQAAMAFSGEVFLRPLTNELQELMEGATKTRIQLGSSLDPGGLSFRLNWKLGPRIELQGSYVFLNRPDKPLGSKNFEDIDIGDLKLKLLLIDHKPLGPLSLESSFGTVRRKDQNDERRARVRLTYWIIYK